MVTHSNDNNGKKDSMLKKANNFFRQGAYEEAISTYLLSALNKAELSSAVCLNVAFARKRFLNERKLKNSFSALILSDVSHNERISYLEKSFNYEDKINSSKFCRDDLSPVSNLDSEEILVRSIFAHASNKSIDIIYVANINLFNILVAIAYKVIWGSVIIFDVKIPLQKNVDFNYLITLGNAKLNDEFLSEDCFKIADYLVLSEGSLYDSYKTYSSFIFPSDGSVSSEDLYNFIKKILAEDKSLVNEEIKSIIKFQRFNYKYINNLIASIDKLDTLKKYPPGSLNSKNKRILLVSYYCPTRAHAGGLRILDIYKLIKKNNPNVQLDLFTHFRPSIDWSIDFVKSIFDSVFLSDQESLDLESFLKVNPNPTKYDVIDLQFHQSGFQIDAYRKIGSKVIFTPMESMTVVAYRDIKSEFEKMEKINFDKVIDSLKWAFEEIEISSKADNVICVSKSDATLLKSVSSLGQINSLDTGLSEIEFDEVLNHDLKLLKPNERLTNVLYIAYFGSETNVKSLQWYLDKVHPLIQLSVPNYKFTVVGRGDLSSFDIYKKDTSINFVGEVPDISPFIHNSKLGIAPALSGGGFRGKINQYSIYGVPCVASEIAHKGLRYKNGYDILIASSANEFAEACIKLLTDNQLNEFIGNSARNTCLKNYTWQSKWDLISKIYYLNATKSSSENQSKYIPSYIEILPPSKIRKTFNPIVTILVPSYNHGKYLKERIDSIYNQTFKSFELFVIDDRSDDNSNEVIINLQQKYGFKYFSNEVNSGTPFSAWEKISTLANGEFIWVCESDDVADKNFLSVAIEKFVKYPDAVLFYSNSHIIDENSLIVGNSSEYFRDIWKDQRWESDFIASGKEELRSYQLRGQIVPNMSSALIKTFAFKSAYTPFLKKLKLTGDWLFIGNVLLYGNVIFEKESLSKFRKHEITSRVRVQSARSQAEFMLTKFIMSRSINLDQKTFAEIMKSDITRFMYEPASWLDVLRALNSVSFEDTHNFLKILALAIKENSHMLNDFIFSYKHSREISNHAN
jgi:glycosyltransferase involved in cell wall biosynthesis